MGECREIMLGGRKGEKERQCHVVTGGGGTGPQTARVAGQAAPARTGTARAASMSGAGCPQRKSAAASVMSSRRGGSAAARAGRTRRGDRKSDGEERRRSWHRAECAGHLRVNAAAAASCPAAAQDAAAVQVRRVRRGTAAGGGTAGSVQAR